MSRKFVLPAVALVTAFALATTAAAGAAEVFRNPTAGFELSKPASWHFLTAERNLENLRGTRLDDEAFHAAMLKYASAPLLVITRYPEPYPDLNPSVKVNVKPFGKLAGTPPERIIDLILPSLRRAFRDLQVVEPPTSVTVAGIRSGYVRFDYTLHSADGTGYPTSSQIWIVPRDAYFFMIGAGTRQDEATGSRAEIAAIIESVKITR